MNENVAGAEMLRNGGPNSLHSRKDCIEVRGIDLRCRTVEESEGLIRGGVSAARKSEIMAAANGSSVNVTMKLLMLLVIGGWMIFWVIRPTSSFTVFFKALSPNKAYGAAGWYIIFYSAPIIFLAVLAAIYLQLNKNSSISQGKASRVNPWTFPVLVRGPLAVVSAAELFLFMLFVGLLAWSLSDYLSVKFAKITPADLRKRDLSLWERKLMITGTNLGLVGVIAMAFLFLPVARGSALFRLLNIPFEHAVKYHIWIGHVMMAIWTAHGLVYVIFWAVTGDLIELVRWSRTDISGLSGLLTWSVGMIMWITALRPIRKKYFERFYYTHQLYVLFILGFALHVGDRLYHCVAGGVVLFFLDRFLRFLQSRNHADVLSARMISSETMELSIAKEPSLKYHPGSFIMVKFPAISPLEWHPFTMVSSSKLEREHLSLLIKCNGGWTSRLKECLRNRKNDARLEVAVEGPYGHNTDYMLRYDILVFVAGGSGISPFISILKELRFNVQNEAASAPKQIVLLWAVKKADDLSSLHLLTPASDYLKELNIDVQAYVTREHGIDLENSSKGESFYISLNGKPRCIPQAEGIHNYGLHAVLITASFIGFVFVVGVLGRCFVYPIDRNTGDVFPRSLHGFFAFVSTIIGVSVFGGGALAIWIKFLHGKGAADELNRESMLSTPSAGRNGLRPSEIHYGNRPHLPDVFSTFAKRFAGSNVGVFVCGPSKMQRSTASQCRRHRFHFHPLSFDL